jgi:hypothetical protein
VVNLTINNTQLTINIVDDFIFLGLFATRRKRPSVQAQPGGVSPGKTWDTTVAAATEAEAVEPDLFRSCSKKKMGARRSSPRDGFGWRRWATGGSTGLGAVADPACPTAELPPPNVKRWTIRRKAAVVTAVANGVLSREEGCRRYQLSEEEFLSWQQAFETHGLPGLRSTRLQHYRGSGARRSHRSDR